MLINLKITDSYRYFKKIISKIFYIKFLTYGLNTFKLGNNIDRGRALLR